MKTIENVSVMELLPQRPPFVMIDRLLSCDETITTTLLEVREENVFVE